MHSVPAATAIVLFDLCRSLVLEFLIFGPCNLRRLHNHRHLLRAAFLPSCTTKARRIETLQQQTSTAKEVTLHHPAPVPYTKTPAARAIATSPLHARGFARALMCLPPPCSFYLRVSHSHNVSCQLSSRRRRRAICETKDPAAFEDWIG